MPPRHGKSELASHWTPTWFVQEFPDRLAGVTSYNGQFARKWGREARTSFRAAWEYHGRRVDRRRDGASEWGSEGFRKGGMIAAGVNEALTGRGLGLLVVDDPIKNAQQALSENYRQSLYDWWQSTAFTRLDRNGVAIVMQCMVGDTRVLMADGTEKALRDIRPGDAIGTYQDGRISCSRVLNWANQGSDRVFRIRTKSGITATANARHPFLIERDGDLQWIRLRNLRIGDRMIRAASPTEPIGVSPANGKAAKSRRSAKGSVCRITARIAGQAAIVRRRRTPNPVAPLTYAVATESTLATTSEFSPSKTAAAPSAAIRQAKTSDRIGAENSASTTITKQAKCGVCYATIATLPLATGKPRKYCCGPLSTYETTPDAIVAIDAAGFEDVFDIQVEGTENFIANGVVSHNTRWHEDDLIGWLVKQAQAGTGLPLRRLRLQAIAGENDPMGRLPGQALCPELGWDEERLNETKRALGGGFWWKSLYQQVPGQMDRAEWPDEYFVDEIWAKTLPSKYQWSVVALDLSKGKDARHGDYVAMVRLSWAFGKYWVESFVRRVAAENVARVCADWVQQRRPDLVYIEGNGGQYLFEPILRRELDDRRLPHPPIVTVDSTDPKEVRIATLGPQLGALLYRFVDSGDNRLLVRMLKEWPVGDFDDGPDALEMATRMINRVASINTIQRKKAREIEQLLNGRR